MPLFDLSPRVGILKNTSLIPDDINSGRGDEALLSCSTGRARTMQLNELNGPQKRVLREALLAAFNPASLDMLLVENDKPSLAVLVAPSAFEQQVFELIKRTQSEGWTDRVVEWAQDKSGNVRIKNLIHDLSLLDVDGDPRLVKSGGKGSLERTVKEKAGISNFMLWADKLMQLRATICRIEDPTIPASRLEPGSLSATT